MRLGRAVKHKFMAEARPFPLSVFDEQIFWAHF